MAFIRHHSRFSDRKTESEAGTALETDRPKALRLSDAVVRIVLGHVIYAAVFGHRPKLSSFWTKCCERK